MTKEMWQLARMHELKDFGERLSHYENDEMLIDEVDEGFCNMMGYTQSELMIRSCGKVGDLIYPPDYEEIRYQIRKKSETERQLHVPLPHEKERRFTYLGVGKRTL